MMPSVGCCIRRLRVWMKQWEYITFLLCLIPAWNIAADCDFTIRSSPDLPKNGTFTSPNYPTRNYGNNLRCYYRFVAMPNERVQIRFVDFEVKGVPPRCVHDYIDIYSQMHDPQEELLDVPLHGRYCGNDLDALPSLIISMYTVLVIGFYTDASRVERGFKAEYSFIDGVYTVGDPAPAHVCGQTIDGTTTPSGTLLSPTWPGMYPDNIFCFYKIHGVKGQRIRFKFEELDLYSGGIHCPYDYVKLYDGFTNEDEVIGTYCGLKRKNELLELYSTTEAMHIEFVTKSGRVEPTDPPYVPYWEKDKKIKRRGFKAHFTVSHDFVDLGYIKEGLHVLGTECDQQVLSTGESNGTIVSPNFPRFYPMNRTCRYYIDGLVNRQNLEKARLTFEDFDMPINETKCSSGSITAFLRGQDILTERADKKFCGQPPPLLVTKDPRMLLVFDTHGTGSPGRGFKANYQFVTDYAIPGTPASDSACHFIYKSESAREGTFNSPRNPSNYPLNTECVYEFQGVKDQHVKIDFESFNIELPGNCTLDYLELFNIEKTRGYTTKEELAGRYCGSTIPGPMVSWSRTVLVRLVTDGTYYVEQGMSGFRAKYEFVDKQPLTKRCFSNVTTGGGGLITSPNYPHKYQKGEVCEHHIYAKHPTGRILLQFAAFAMEGNLDNQGCPLAVLKIFTNHSGWPQYELCGQDPKQNFILSQENYIKLQFISSKNGVGGKGFKITWTEILPEPDGYCSGFRCQVNKYCIDMSLKCNKLPNCGPDDRSDETEKCGPAYTDHGVLHIILGVVIALIVLVFLIVCILHRRRKQRKKKNKKEIEVRYVTRAAYSSSSSSHNKNDIHSDHADRTLLKERTEKVSIV